MEQNLQKSGRKSNSRRESGTEGMNISHNDDKVNRYLLFLWRAGSSLPR